MKTLTFLCAVTLLCGLELQAADWTIDSADDWTTNIQSAKGATVADGSDSPKAKTATIVTRVHASDVKRSVRSLVVTQSAIWQNWNPIENLGPKLPAGYGFQIQLRLTDSTENKSKPIIERMSLSLAE